VFSRKLKAGYFALEGLNSFATVFYFYYLYFYMQKAYGFGNKANLLLAALNGGTYALVVWFAGRFAQRRGYFTALKVGYVIMIAALGIGLGVRSAPEHVGVMVLVIFGMSFTWPTLEALVSEREEGVGLQHMVGIYNVVWAATAALGNFTGGAMLQKLGLSSLFYVPMAVHMSQLGLTLWLESKAMVRLSGLPTVVDTGAARDFGPRMNSSNELVKKPQLRGGLFESDRGGRRIERVQSKLPMSTARCGELAFGEGFEIGVEPTVTLAHGVQSVEVRKTMPHPLPKARRFLRMAWVANPFAYVAINTLIAVIPGVARRLELSTMAAGFCCSVWCFARLGAFALLWRWTAWHYRFRWLLLAYLALVGSFGAVVLAHSLATLVLAQLVFGGAVGLIYYSSLFYSMDRSETKGEHGGIHEAAIGLGNCAGPAVGAATLHLIPQHSQSGTIAVILLLLCGLGGLVRIWKGGELPYEEHDSKV
jgi:predicted MFS family arabinose efflux permease